MGTVTATLTNAKDVSAPFSVKAGQSFDWTVDATTFTGTVQLQRGNNEGTGSWTVIDTATADDSGTVISERDAYYRFRLATIEEGDDPVDVSIADATDNVQVWRNLAGDIVLGINDAGVDINGGTVDGVTSFSLANDVFILSTPGAPVDYTDGSPAATGEGTAGIGSLCVRRDTGKWYTNGGTKAEPIWKLVTSAA